MEATGGRNARILTDASGRFFTVDMNEKPDGIWNFTSIHIPPYVDVSFIKNPANTPVIWLASDQSAWTSAAPQRRRGGSDPLRWRLYRQARQPTWACVWVAKPCAWFDTRRTAS